MIEVNENGKIIIETDLDSDDVIEKFEKDILDSIEVSISSNFLSKNKDLNGLKVCLTFGKSEYRFINLENILTDWLCEREDSFENHPMELEEFLEEEKPVVKSLLKRVLDRFNKMGDQHL